MGKTIVFVLICCLMMMVAGPVFASPSSSGASYEEEGSMGEIIVAMILVGIAGALITIRIFAYGMNTARRQAGASQYAKGLELTGSSDIFLYSRTTSRKIQSK
jgi:hypothetical protein